MTNFINLNNNLNTLGEDFLPNLIIENFQIENLETCKFFKFEETFILTFISLDIELTESQLLIGIFFVSLDLYVSVYLSKDLAENQSLLKIFKIYYSSLSLNNKYEHTFSEDFYLYYKGNKENFKKDVFIQNCLFTFNGKNFDLPLLTTLFSCQSIDFISLWNISQQIIKDSYSVN